MAIQSFPFALSVGSSIYSCTNAAAPPAAVVAAAALDGRSTFLGFQDCLPRLCQESGGFRSVASTSSSGISQKQGRKHGSCNPGAMSFCAESMTQSCFSCGSLFVSKICVYPQQQRQNVHPTIITTRSKCLSSSVEVDQEIVDDGSTSERVSEEPLTNSVSVKKTLRPLRLAPKPPMRKISVESPIKDEKILDSSSETASKMESARVTSPSETITPFQSPEALPKESRRGKIGRRSQMDEFLELRSELKDDQASRDLISLISYIRFVLHVKHDAGQRLEPKDESLIREKLLPYHPEREEKLEKGVQYIKVDWHPEFQTRCFFIARDDGSFLDFSFRKCILQFGQQTVGLSIARRLLDLVFF